MACRAVARSCERASPPLRCARFGATAFAHCVATGEGWWSRWVTLPHRLACRASALLVCHDPGKIGKPPWCCPRQAEFWRLGCTGWCAACSEIGAVAGNGLPKPCESDAPNGTVRYRELQCTRMVAVRKDLRAGSHSAVKSQPRKLKGPEVSLHFQPMPFQQRTNTSW